MNFNALHELFNCNEENENEEFPLHLSSSYDVYPQAGMFSYGHVVSKGLIQQYYPFIDRLTHEIGLDVMRWMMTGTPEIPLLLAESVVKSITL